MFSKCQTTLKLYELCFIGFTFSSELDVAWTVEASYKMIVNSTTLKVEARENFGITKQACARRAVM